MSKTNIESELLNVFHSISKICKLLINFSPDRNLRGDYSKSILIDKRVEVDKNSNQKYNRGHGVQPKGYYHSHKKFL